MKRSNNGLSKVGGRVGVVLALVAGALVVPACKSEKESNTTPPKAPAPPPVAYGDVCKATGLTPIFYSEPGACPESHVGYGGCLDPSFDDGNEFYDVWYCEKAGDIITLCACGDTFICDDTGSGIVCEEF